MKKLFLLISLIPCFMGANLSYLKKELEQQNKEILIKIDEKNKGWCILLDANLTKNDQIGVNDKEAEHNVYLNPFLGKIQNNNIAGNVAILNEVNGTDTTSASDEKNFKYLSVYYN